MALYKSSIQLLVQAKRQNLIGGKATRLVLELGEQNWYGDVDPESLHGLIDQFCSAEPERQKLHAGLNHCIRERPADWLFDVAQIFYQMMLEFDQYAAIDLHGTARAIRHDLNTPLALGRQFQFVTNLGTGEHFFNQYQFFRTLHEHTAPGGLMLQSLPNQGAYDHGFYNYHPTFLFDLCQANAYQILVCLFVDGAKHTLLSSREDYVRLLVQGELGANAHTGLLFLLRKPAQEAPFRTPQQGYYEDRLSPELREAWRKFSRG